MKLKRQPSEWRAFRHGKTTSRPVYQPGKKRSPRYLFDGQRREHVIDQVAETLASGVSSPFQREGDCRHGLRAGFCLEGHGWARSDLEAERIVNLALEKIGAERPTWEEGQREATASPDFCVWCHGPNDAADSRPGQRFCSAECARAAKQHFAAKNEYYGGAVLRAAQRLIDRSKAPERVCEECGKSYGSDRPHSRFCSKVCADRHRRTREDQRCDECGDWYRPTNPDQRFCSHSCGSLAHQRDVREGLSEELRECACCGDIFTPTSPDNIYCRPRCASTMANRAYRERLGRAAHNCTCRLCGDAFISRMPWAEYCSKDHRRMAQAIMKPTKKRKLLSVPAFDLIFSFAQNPSD